MKDISRTADLSQTPILENDAINRRRFFATAVMAAAGAALAPKALAAERDWTGKNPVRYPDPDILVLDERFAKYKVGNTPIQKLWTGALWAEGCAWNGVGRWVVDAIGDRDYFVIQSSILIFAIIFLIVNLSVDIGYAFLNPRIRYS